MNSWNLETLDVRPQQPVVLQSDEGAARVVAINLPAGDSLDDHQVHEHAWLHVHAGRVEIDADGTTHDAGTGTLVHWEPAERHAVRAIEDARLLLMLAPWPGPGHPSLRGREVAASG